MTELCENRTPDASQAEEWRGKTHGFYYSGTNNTYAVNALLDTEKVKSVKLKTVGS